MKKPFNKEAAKRGEPVEQRNGRHTRYVGESLLTDTCYTLMFEYEDNDGDWSVCSYTDLGEFHPSGGESEHDLFMASKKKQLWARAYKNPENSLYLYWGSTREELTYALNDHRSWAGEPILLAEIEEDE